MEVVTMTSPIVNEKSDGECDTGAEDEDEEENILDLLTEGFNDDEMNQLAAVCGEQDIADNKLVPVQPNYVTQLPQTSNDIYLDLREKLNLKRLQILPDFNELNKENRTVISQSNNIVLTVKIRNEDTDDVETDMIEDFNDRAEDIDENDTRLEGILPLSESRICEPTDNLLLLDEPLPNIAITRVRSKSPVKTAVKSSNNSKWSRSPGRRSSRSPKTNNRSRSGSLVKSRNKSYRSKSPKRRSRTPKKKKYSRSPKDRRPRRSRSKSGPRKTRPMSKSPLRRLKSPRKKSFSPNYRRSPARYSKSPMRNTKTYNRTRKSRSNSYNRNRKRSRSPYFRNLKRSRSPRRFRSRSPRKIRRSSRSRSRDRSWYSSRYSSKSSKRSRSSSRSNSIGKNKRYKKTISRSRSPEDRVSRLVMKTRSPTPDSCHTNGSDDPCDEVSRIQGEIDVIEAELDRLRQRKLQNASQPKPTLETAVKDAVQPSSQAALTNEVFTLLQQLKNKLTWDSDTQNSSQTDCNNEKHPVKDQTSKTPTKPNAVKVHYEDGVPYPFITDADNKTIPLHMTPDGVIRLPDSRCVVTLQTTHVPTGRSGEVFEITTDGRPTHACFNFPRFTPKEEKERTRQKLPKLICNYYPDRTPCTVVEAIVPLAELNKVSSDRRVESFVAEEPVLQVNKKCILNFKLPKPNYVVERLARLRQDLPKLEDSLIQKYKAEFKKKNNVEDEQDAVQVTSCLTGVKKSTPARLMSSSRRASNVSKAVSDPLLHESEPVFKEALTKVKKASLNCIPNRIIINKTDNYESQCRSPLQQHKLNYITDTGKQTTTTNRPSNSQCKQSVAIIKLVKTTQAQCDILNTTNTVDINVYNEILDKCKSLEYDNELMSEILSDHVNAYESLSREYDRVVSQYKHTENQLCYKLNDFEHQIDILNREILEREDSIQLLKSGIVNKL